MSLARVGILHRPGAAAGLAEIYKSAQGICEPVLILQESAAGHAGVLEAARDLFRTEVVTDTELAPAFRRLGVTGLTTFHDLELDLLDTSLRELALPGLGSVAHPWDKLVQRQQIPAELSGTLFGRPRPGAAAERQRRSVRPGAATIPCAPPSPRTCPTRLSRTARPARR
jgi:hypothetical protein